MNYGIVIFPSKQIQDDANALRKRYDPSYALIPPHITLKAPFTVDDSLRDTLVEELKEITKQIKPFKINIHKVSTFAPLNNVAYYKVEPIPELTQLNERLNQGNFPKSSEYAFVPHITIAQKLTENEFSDVYDTLQLTQVEFEDVVDRIQLCYQLENGSWTVYETFVFGEG